MRSMERKALILDELKSRGSVDVLELSKRFSVSEVTIRRDLSAMENEHVIHRTHGGAVLNESYLSQQRDFPYSIRKIQHYQSKENICRLASDYIEDGDIIYIDNSSTLLCLPHYISPSLSVTILTNSIGILCEASKLNNRSHTYVCLGGIYNCMNLSTYGNLALSGARDFFPTKCFVSCASISSDGVVTDASIHELDVKTLMIGQSSKAFLLADSSKLGVLDKVYLCDLKSFQHLICDDDSIYQKLNPGALDGLQIHICSPYHPS